MMTETQEERSSEQTIQQLAELHAAHSRSATSVQRFANRVTAALGHPSAVMTMLVLIIGWMAGNYAATRLGLSALEQAPFPDLGFLATIIALLVALLILTTQRHADALAEDRAQLTLQIALLSERKIAKIIELLEEQRRDNPLLVSRTDAEAESMAQPSDPLSTLDRIKDELLPE